MYLEDKTPFAEIPERAADWVALVQQLTQLVSGLGSKLDVEDFPHLADQAIDTIPHGRPVTVGTSGTALIPAEVPTEANGNHTVAAARRDPPRP